MVATVPADFIVLSRAEAAVAIACVEIAVRYCPDARARGLLDSLRDATSASGIPHTETAPHSLAGDGTVTSRAAAEMLRCDPRRVLQLRQLGDLRGEKVGRDWQIELASVHALLEQRRISA